MLEIKLEDLCCKKVHALGGIARKMKDIGQRGWPDRMMLLPGGRVFFVEFKREKGGVVSAQQKKMIRCIEAVGLSVHVIDTYEQFEAALATEI